MRIAEINEEDRKRWRNIYLLPTMHPLSQRQCVSPQHHDVSSIL